MKKLSIIVLAMLFVVAMASTAFAASYNATTPYVYSNSTMTPTTGMMKDTLVTGANDKDNGINNANGSGIGVEGQGVNTGVIKSQNMKNNANGAPATQRTHGQYQNNTNSCASCHQTHTGASKNLLFKNGVYATCTACHDGTLGFYNVFNASSAGTFGGTMDGNASVHLATGAQKISAAPGGNKTGTAGGWTSDFTCASCHAPHGSYSDRLLHYNPNGLGTVAPTTDLGGKQKVNVNVYGANGVGIPAAAAAAANTTIVIIDTVQNLSVNAAIYGFAGSPAAAHTPVTDYVAVAVNKATAGWTVDKNPWLYGYVYGSPKNYYSALKVGSGTAGSLEIQPDSTNYPSGVHYELGLAYVDLGNGSNLKHYNTTTKVMDPIALTDIKFADISPATITKLTFKAAPVANFGGIDITAVDTDQYSATGKGVQMSGFCAACHVDYMQASSAGNAGKYTQAYRHTTNSDTYTCLKCHFAHGTDVTVMKDAKDKTVADLVAQVGGPYQNNEPAAKAYMLDQNPSSALKRYTNMAVCWKCHTDSKAEQLKNNQFFWDNYSTVPHGF